MYGSELKREWKIRKYNDCPFLKSVEYECQQLRAAMKGPGSDEDFLIEIITSRPNWVYKKKGKNIRVFFEKISNKKLKEKLETITMQQN